MVGVKQTSDTNGSRGYYLPASLVNKLIVSILTGIAVIAGYMILWAYNDIQFKTQLEARMNQMAVQVDKMEDHIDPKNHPDGELRAELAKQHALISAMTVRQELISKQLNRIENTLDSR